MFFENTASRSWFSNMGENFIQPRNGMIKARKLRLEWPEATAKTAPAQAGVYILGQSSHTGLAGFGLNFSRAGPFRYDFFQGLALFLIFPRLGRVVFLCLKSFLKTIVFLVIFLDFQILDFSEADPARPQDLQPCPKVATLEIDFATAPKEFDDACSSSQQMKFWENVDYKSENIYSRSVTNSRKKCMSKCISDSRCESFFFDDKQRSDRRFLFWKTDGHDCFLTKRTPGFLYFFLNFYYHYTEKHITTVQEQ